MLKHMFIAAAAAMCVSAVDIQPANQLDAELDSELDNEMESEQLGAAILSKPKEFAEAFKTAVEGTGMAIDQIGKMAEGTRKFLKQSPKDRAIIVNLTDKWVTWYTYNEWSLIRHTTN